MTPETFRTRLRGLELGLAGFSRLTGISASTAGYWGRRRPGAPRIVAFPMWVELLLALWEANVNLQAVVDQMRADRDTLQIWEDAE